MLLKFYPPDQGTIRLFSRDIMEFGADELRSMVAYIEQTPVLLYDTIYRNICCGLDNVVLPPPLIPAMAVKVFLLNFMVTSCKICFSLSYRK